MWPPTTGLGSKQVPPEGDTIAGYYVPGGTQIAHNFSGVMRLPRIWGEDADVFRPERWLEAEGERLKEMQGTVELVFGSGKYQCLGSRVAMVELNKVFVEVSSFSKVGGCSWGWGSKVYGEGMLIRGVVV